MWSPADSRNKKLDDFDEIPIIARFLLLHLPWRDLAHHSPRLLFITATEPTFLNSVGVELKRVQLGFTPTIACPVLDLDDRRLLRETQGSQSFPIAPGRSLGDISCSAASLRFSCWVHHRAGMPVREGCAEGEIRVSVS